jgi:MFS transporter, DHA1 family, inner membrane transport protein
MTKHPALLILAIWAAGLGAAAQFGKISVLYDDLVAIYGGSGRVALMVSVVGMVGLIFGTTAGILVQRLGLRAVLLAALVMGAAISAFQATMPAYPLMMASRMLEGVSHLAIVVVGPVMIAQAASLRFQGLAMTLWSSFFGLSYAALAVIGPLLTTEGPHRLFLAHSGYMLAIALLLWPLLPRVELPPPPAITLAGLARQHGQIGAGNGVFLLYDFLRRDPDPAAADDGGAARPCRKRHAAGQHCGVADIRRVDAAPRQRRFPGSGGFCDRIGGFARDGPRLG